MSRRVLIYVQHLLGIGHVRRMVLVANALDAQGAEVLFVTGGAPVPHIRPEPGVELLQLPAISAADVDFSGLVDDHGEPVDDWLKQQRTDMLIAAVQDFTPDIILVEMFPFGRRQMRFELLPMLESAREMSPRPRIVSSVRDIINSRPHRMAEMFGWLNTCFDEVLVHSDPDLFDLAESVPGLDQFTGRVRYSGYITPPAARDEFRLDGEAGEILVSAGGGAVGENLFDLAATTAGRMPNLKWRFRHRAQETPARLAHWRRLAPVAVFEPVGSNFLHQLQHAGLSISQAGYNTVCDLFRTGCRSILVPFAGGSETEQTRRSERLSSRGFAVLPPGASTDKLGELIHRTLQAPPPDIRDIRMDGAAESARILLNSGDG